MLKKIFNFILATILIVSCAACSNNKTPQSSEELTTGNTQITATEQVDNKDIKLSQTLTFMGFEFAYPEGINLSNSDYGQTFRYNSEIAVLIEAPSVAGIMLEVTDINDVATASEEYVVKTLENTVRELFNFDATTQSISDSKIINVNEIEMLRVEGAFMNTAKSSNVDFVGYYFLLDSDPIYIIGVPMNDNISVDTFIDNLAVNIKKK